jgi:hypothetical protein
LAVVSGLLCSSVSSVTIFLIYRRGVANGSEQVSLVWLPSPSIPFRAPLKKAVNAKVDALALMDKAVEPYASHRNDVAVFQIELEKTYEYERGRPLNRNTIMQWDILRDPNRDLLGGFLKEWKENEKLMPVYIERKKAQIGTAFDQIIQLESGKIKTAAG